MNPRYKVFNSETGEPIALVDSIADAVHILSGYPEGRAILDTYSGMILI